MCIRDRNSWTRNPRSMIHPWDICAAAITTGREAIQMVNDETRRKLRLMNIGEFVEELEIQQQDPQTLALPFDDRFQMLTDNVYQRKYNDKVQRLIKNAKLRLPKADIHDILYIDKRPLNRGIIADPVSYTHLDVYKRQSLTISSRRSATSSV